MLRQKNRKRRELVQNGTKINLDSLFLKHQELFDVYLSMFEGVGLVKELCNVVKTRSWIASD